MQLIIVDDKVILPVQVIETLNLEKDGVSGVVFMAENGKRFRLGFHRFSFYLGKEPKTKNKNEK